MRFLKPVAIFLILVVCLYGCVKTPTPDDAAAFTVTDMAGREVSFDEAAKSVVALTAADCEILYAIGAGDMLVGRGEYCDYPAQALLVASVESGSETDIEQIIALDPDVVFMGKMAQTKQQVSSLESAGIAVVVSDAQNIDGVYEAITLIGSVTGKSAQAAFVVEEMKQTFAFVSGESTGETVYFEASPLEYGLWTAGSGTFMDEVATMLGLTNSFADVEGWSEISEEQVIARSPDYIVTLSMYLGEGLEPEKEIASRSGWETITAVKNSAILRLSDNELSRPGPRLADGARALYDFVSFRQSKTA